MASSWPKLAPSNLKLTPLIPELSVALALIVTVAERVEPDVGLEMVIVGEVASKVITIA